MKKLIKENHKRKRMKKAMLELSMSAIVTIIMGLLVLLLFISMLFAWVR
jgi:uncharacterized membrane protein